MEENKPRPAGHEESDADVVAVGKFAVALVLVLMASMVLLFGLFRYFQSAEGTVGVSVDPAKAFPQPQLERTPVVDLKEIRAAEDRLLSSYGWVEPQKGVVRIPIDRAIDLLAQRGLPARPPGGAAASDDSAPTESGLGRKMQPPGGPLAGEAQGQSK